MPERWVLNASPLIVLSRVNLGTLPLVLADQVLVPDAVASEVLAGPNRDPARRMMAAGTYDVIEIPSALPELLAWDLGAGETAVLAWAVTYPGWTAILDDGEARRCARAFSIPVKGTLAVVLLAKQRGLIPSAARVLEQLLEIGFHLDERIIRKALENTVDETWPAS